MPKNLPAWPKRLLLFLAAILLVLSGLLYGQDSAQQVTAQQVAAQDNDDLDPVRLRVTVPPNTRWYRSNASGMMLFHVPSQSAALRNEYALAVSLVSRNEIPPLLLQYFASAYSIELRTLFNNGEMIREQWIFRDSRGTTRLNASGTDGLFLEDGLEEGKGFIEIYNAGHTLTEERLFSQGSESLTHFTYTGNLLIRADTWIKEPPPTELSPTEPHPETAAETPEASDIEEALSDADSAASARPFGPGSPPDITDYYRYTRSASLRAIERVYHSGGISSRRIPFPSISPIFPKEPEFENPGVAHSSEFLDDVIDVPIPPGGRSIFSTDNRGRILSERRLDENGELLGELTNIWTGDRLISVSWKSGDDEWLIEYEYDEKGDRILERNFNRGLLERIVRSEGNREVEELYMTGRLILRAVYEDGRKISEERVRENR
jgi:hypothetical protein